MNQKFLIAAAAAMLLAGASPAQCPRQRAQTIPDATTTGPVIACGGVRVDIPGLQIATTTGCPVTVTVVPEHEVATATPDETRVEVAAQVSGRLVTLTCRGSYLLFFRIGSSCEVFSDVAFGTYLRLITKPCE
jgi:phage tail sheath gpL-like